MISGYTGPMTLLQGLRDDFDVVFVDAATHYSARDAIPTLGKPAHSFGHLDAGSLAEALSRDVGTGQRPVVVVDGVFPSTGALAPLADCPKAMAPYNGALLCIDDSHGAGAIGESGRGSLEHACLETEGNYFAGTLSKAFGALGGVIPGDAALAEKVGRNAMIMRGASLPPPSAAAAAAHPADDAANALRPRPQCAPHEKRFARAGLRCRRHADPYRFHQGRHRLRRAASPARRTRHRRQGDARDIPTPPTCR